MNRLASCLGVCWILLAACDPPQDAGTTVAPAPTVTRFAPTASPITTGRGATLVAEFANGTATVDHGVGPVRSGVAFETGALSSNTTFTLTVTNGGGQVVTARAEVEVVPRPVATSLSFGRGLVTTGETTTLTPVFTGGTGVIDGGIGAVSSGVPVTTAALLSTTTFTLTVTNPAGETATVTALVDVVAAPVISGFSTAASPITAGTATTLTAVFSGGTGVIDGGLGAVVSGAPVGTGALAATTRFTLTVTNAAGATATASTTVDVAPVPAVTGFTAARSLLTRGETTTLTALFTGGVGVIDQGIGPVEPGVPVSTPTLQGRTTFTLTVINAAGTPVTATVTVDAVAAPAIGGFAAAATPITAGGGTSLVADFTGGAGVVDGGVGPIFSGVPVSTGNLAASRTYTLTVTNTAGTAATARVTVEVVAPPAVTGFTAARATITRGEATTLTPVFAGGTGLVDHGVGPVTSGVPVSTGALAATTAYTLTVTNAAGRVATAQAQVEVVQQPAVTSLLPGRSLVTRGETTTLTPVFAGGTGVIDGGIGAVGSGVAVTTAPLQATTTFTLTVTNPAGGTATATATVQVVAPPVISGFAPAASPITAGSGTTLTAVFSGGTGLVDGGVGTVVSGAPVATGALAATTRYTLTVTNAAGATVTASATVDVAPVPVVTGFSAARSLLTRGETTTLTAIFAGGTGVIDQGVGPVLSGVPVGTPALLGGTTFTLTVVNAAGTAVTATVTVDAVAAPAITRFVAAATPITAGGGTTLAADFTGGAGVIDGGLGSVLSGVPVSTGNLAAARTYTLTVTNTAGAAATARVTVEVVAPAAVTGFTAARATVTRGEATTLTAVFAGGTGVVDSGVGPVTSGVPVSTGALAATTAYTLTVTNAAGQAATRSATVEVVAAPAILRFEASPASVLAGGSSRLFAEFTGGTGSVDGVGAVTSGLGVDVGPLAVATTYTLRVTNAAGTEATASTTVEVVNAPQVITFTTEGETFAPVIVVTGSPAIRWTFPDGSTSTSATPSVSFGSVATRQVTLQVTPWSAVTRINIGYDAGDDGPTNIERVPDQHVSAVDGLALVAGSLRQWCSSYNDLVSLDFSNFVALEDIESFKSSHLSAARLRNTPSLKRVVFEDTHLGELDISTSLGLNDLRAAGSTYLSLVFAQEVYPSLTHICVRDNPQFIDPQLFADGWRWPALGELWIWNTNQEGSLRVQSTRATGPVSVIADDNRYTTLDFRGAFQGGWDEASISAERNRVTSIDITGCHQLTQVDLKSNPISAEAEDALLATLDGFGRVKEANMGWPFLVDLRGNAVPTAAGRASAARLAAKGWTVYTDAWVEAP